MLWGRQRYAGVANLASAYAFDVVASAYEVHDLTSHVVRVVARKSTMRLVGGCFVDRLVGR